ncbi:MAG: hypothetical protein KJN90_11490 [Gammaproteobacteria bacterium]|nr:hypothetical protein [Gammaproteobacteria bacterium]
METSVLVIIFTKLGVPLFGGTLVACLLTMTFEWIHAVLMLIGITALCIDASITVRMRRGS